MPGLNLNGNSTVTGYKFGSFSALYQLAKIFLCMYWEDSPDLMVAIMPSKSDSPCVTRLALPHSIYGCFFGFGSVPPWLKMAIDRCQLLHWQLLTTINRVAEIIKDATVMSVNVMLCQIVSFPVWSVWQLLPWSKNIYFLKTHRSSAALPSLSRVSFPTEKSTAISL